jgi:hypothetical protein
MNVLPKTKTLLYGILITAFLYVSVFALPAMATMEHHEMGGAMSNCPFMVGETALCQMNIFDHIASWQAMFIALPAELSTVLLLLLSLVLACVWLRHLFDPPDTSQLKSLFSYSRETHAPSFRAVLLGSVISPRAP